MQDFTEHIRQRGCMPLIWCRETSVFFFALISSCAALRLHAGSPHPSRPGSFLVRPALFPHPSNGLYNADQVQSRWSAEDPNRSHWNVCWQTLRAYFSLFSLRGPSQPLCLGDALQVERIGYWHTCRSRFLFASSQHFRPYCFGDKGISAENRKCPFGPFSAENFRWPNIRCIPTLFFLLTIDIAMLLTVY